MVKLTIDGINVEVKEGTTILEAAKTIGINIPTLCYFKELNEIGACRVCVVEVKGANKLSAACNTVVADGMEVLTDSPRARNARKTNVQLILSQHSCHCPTCIRNGNCALQSLAAELNVNDMPYETKLPKSSWCKSFPLIRDDEKCIKCMRCVNVCDKIQSLNVWEVNGSGAHTKVGVRGGVKMKDINCSLCGQCITHCPVGALTARDDTAKAYKALADEEKITVFQIAPAVRAAWGDGLGLPAEIATEKRMAAAAKALGADYVFDTNFTADLTIMEEGSEFIERMTNPGKFKMPMFTSCCPGWVRFMKLEYPELADNLSTAKSPQQMFGSVAKSFFAQKLGVEPDKIFCISVMPCTAKKYECDVPELNDAAEKDVDLVLTTREFTRMLRESHINIAELKEREFDSPLGTGTGAAVIFGATGGVMEAALRSAYFLITGKNPDVESFAAVRGGEGNTGIREATYNVNGITVRTATASGLANARKLCVLVKAGKAPYDFIEIMACPGGCAGGGGQPICDGSELAVERGERLYKLDRENTLRFSHENPDVLAIYKEFFEKPLSHKSHELLHTKQSEWSLK